MNLFIIGTGLIGGSFALAVKEVYNDVTIFGIDKSEHHLEEALRLGVIDEKAVLEDVTRADMVIAAVPVNVLSGLLAQVLDLVNDETVVIDAGSTKSHICEDLEHHPKRRNFLAAHPIAGTEFSGPSAAIHGLYKHKTNIICEVEKTAFKLQEKALKVFTDIGMRIRYMDPKAHDRHIAYVSHLSHISSFMLGKTVIEKEENERDVFDMAGSGFESTVRLAKSSPAMWAPIFQQNKENILETLNEYIANLQGFRDLMLADDFEAIYQTMENTNKIKEILKGISVKN